MAIVQILKNKFLQQTVFYGLSTAFNKGLILFALPLLLSRISLEDYGLWSLSQTIISLGIPILSLNGQAGVIRVATENKLKGWQVTASFFNLQILIIIAFCISAFFLPLNWVLLTLFIALLDALSSVLLGWYRANDMHIKYFLLILTKIISIILIISFINTPLDIILVLKYQLIFGAILATPFFIEVFYRNFSPKFKFVFNNILMFSITLIPHSVSQWVLSGSDRILIEWKLGESALGKYSLAYSIAMVLLLVNSGLGLTIPNDMINNYQSWFDGNRRRNYIFLYSILYLLIASFVLLLCNALKNKIHFLNDVDEEVLKLMVWIFGGLYLLGIYLFYVSILFYHKKSKIIAIITFLSALINLILTYILISSGSVLGAAIATFFSYLFYTSLIIVASNFQEAKLSKTLSAELSIVAVTLVLTMTLLFQLF